MNDFDALAKLIQAIEPWRGHLVLVGGWAHRLHRFHPAASKLPYNPIATKDTDLAFRHKAPLEGDIKQALEAAGFEEELSGDHRPPVTRYTLGEDDAGFYAEFLTPLVGSGMRRTGEPDATVLAGGITAQKLRHLELLLIRPWHIRIGPELGVPLPQPLDLQVVNPVAFIAQKLLIQDDRSPAKRAQDFLYIHDSVELFGSVMPELNNLWKDAVYPELHPNIAKRVVELSQTTFSKVTDTAREAARIPPDRTLSPERMVATCEVALHQILKVN